eukprot:scpid79211/ scgid21132/ 
MKVVTNVGHHSHASEPGRKEVLEVRDGMVKRSRETMDSSHQIVSGSLSTVSRTAACQLPSQKSLKRALQRERVRASNAPANPGTLAELLLPEAFQTTKAGEEFVLHDSGPEAGDIRFLVFSTADNVRTLLQNNIWHADGTFTTVPHLFQQL